jgi:hypothetical protein
MKNDLGEANPNLGCSIRRVLLRDALSHPARFCGYQEIS